MSVEGVTHLAGDVITFNAEEGQVMRQRCSWCGATLLDVNLSRIAVPEGQDPTYPHWKVGAFVEAHAPDNQGGMWAESSWAHPDPVPANSCMRMPLEVTG